MDEMDEVRVEARTSDANGEETTSLPPFYKRLVDVFFSPGRLGAALREHPAWAVAMVVGALLVVAMVALIPEHIWVEMQRQALLRSGRQVPTMSAGALAFMRWFRPVTAGLVMVISEFFYAGVVTLIFAFVLGDEGRYRQYLSVVTHGWLISMVIEALMVPLKISQADPQFTVSIGTFFFFLPQGYLLKALNSMALSKLWADLVVAAGVHAIDPKRRFATAAAVLIILTICMSLIGAIFTPTMG